MFWIFMMYYAGLPYTGGQQCILQHLLGCKGDKQPKTDISESCGLFLEISPLIRAIVAGFLGDAASMMAVAKGMRNEASMSFGRNSRDMFCIVSK